MRNGTIWVFPCPEISRKGPSQAALRDEESDPDLFSNLETAVAECQAVYASARLAGMSS
jgi:hypothetical protein